MYLHFAIDTVTNVFSDIPALRFDRRAAPSLPWALSPAIGIISGFGFRFGDFKNTLDLDALHERHQDKIMALANSIDPISFEESSFNDVFLSKFGEYINKDLIPKLFEAQSNKQNGLSKTLQLLYMLFGSMVVIGVLIPLLSILLGLPPFLLVLSYSFVISAIVFMVISGLSFLSKTLTN